MLFASRCFDSWYTIDVRVFHLQNSKIWSSLTKSSFHIIDLENMETHSPFQAPKRQYKSLHNNRLNYKQLDKSTFLNIHEVKHESLFKNFSLHWDCHLASTVWKIHFIIFPVIIFFIVLFLPRGLLFSLHHISRMWAPDIEYGILEEIQKQNTSKIYRIGL